MKKMAFIFYVSFLILLTIFSYLFVDQNLIYYHSLYSGFAFINRTAVSIGYLLSVVIFFVFYLRVIILVRKKQLSSKEIKYLIGFTVLISLFAYPAFLSYDIFNYIATAKVLFHYHENPYLIMPIVFIGDQMLLFTHAANKVALYGPFWIILTGIPFLFGTGNFFLTIISFKLLTTIFYLLTIFIIWKFTKNLLAVALVAFNPLIVIETLMSGHNDIVMIFLALFSLFLLKQRRIVLSIMFIILSILIKYATVFLFPIFIYVLIKIIRQSEIDWEKVFLWSSISMFIIFLLSPLREELYPWYAIWFLIFALCLTRFKLLLYFFIALSFGLALRYLPFMYFGTYFGITPVSRIILTLIPILAVGLFYLTKLKRS